MLAHRAPYLDTYYEPEREYIPFETLDECVEKVKFYLQNEAARSKIAAAYAQRTEAEHLWSHRIQSVLRDAGIA
jgi:spore maturation protein CgeB